MSWASSDSILSEYVSGNIPVERNGNTESFDLHSSTSNWKWLRLDSIVIDQSMQHICRLLVIKICNRTYYYYPNTNNHLQRSHKLYNINLPMCEIALRSTTLPQLKRVSNSPAAGGWIGLRDVPQLACTVSIDGRTLGYTGSWNRRYIRRWRWKRTDKYEFWDLHANRSQ
jgi:hypothetical protein